MSFSPKFVLPLFLLASLAGPALADLRVPAGELTRDEAGVPIGEKIALPAELRRAVAGLALGQRVEIAAFPIAPGVRQEIWLERVDYYAPGARVFVVDGQNPPQPIERSTRLQLRGGSALDSSLRLGLTADPGGDNLSGVVLDGQGTRELAAPSAGDERHEIFDANKKDLGVPLESTCGAEELPRTPEAMMAAVHNPPAERVAGTPLYSAIVAVDTDNEFNHKKFANNTTAANNWIASLFAGMNVMYERDLAVTLVQGDTFLRRDLDASPTYNDDPWTVTGSPASSTHLNEFGNWWAANQNGVDRTFAMLLSGKATNGNSSSGIAWLDGYCENQSSGGGYSVTQVFFNPAIPVINDVRVIGHELGHNFGSPHTHCYVPPIDFCYNAQAGCYAGATSCPGGPGTIMSYCHLNGCGSNLTQFHPRSISLINTFILPHVVNGCLESGAGNIFANGFESGNTGAWSATS